MRPRIRADARYTPTDGGVVWLTPAGVVAMRGNGIARWLDALVPTLDGRTDLDVLLDRVPASRQPVIREIVARLADLGVLVDDAGPDGAPEDVPVLLVGAVPLLRAAVATVAAAGLGEVRALAYHAPGIADAVANGVTVHLCALADAHRLDALCTTSGARVLHAVLFEGGACVGPTPPGPGTPWAAVAGRLAGDRPRAPYAIDPALRDLVVAEALHHARHAAVGPAVAGTGRSVLLVSGDSQVTRHDFTPCPYQVPVSAVTVPTSRAPAATRPFAERVVRLVDPRFGIITGIGEAGHRQTPLHVSEALVRRPGDPGATPARLVAAGETLAESRANVAREALEWYAAHCFDPRRVGQPGAGDADAADTPAPRLVTGRRLTDGGSVSLRIDDVFALSRTPASAVPAGVGSGESRSEAVLAGLLSLVGQRALAAAGREPVPALSTDDGSGADRTRAALSVLTAAGLSAVDLCDLTAHSGVPTVGVVSRGLLVAVAGDLRLAGAIRQAVRMAVSRHRSTVDAPGPAVSLRTGPAMLPPPADMTLDSVVRALTARGIVPVVADLDHDPAIGIALPHVVRVVLRDG